LGEAEIHALWRLCTSISVQSLDKKTTTLIFNQISAIFAMSRVVPQVEYLLLVLRFRRSQYSLDPDNRFENSITLGPKDLHKRQWESLFKTHKLPQMIMRMRYTPFS
jgi:hypothetical protein